MKYFYLTHRWDSLTGTIRVGVELRGIAMKEYSTFPKTPELEPHHQMQFSAISRTTHIQTSAHKNKSICDKIVNKYFVSLKSQT